MSAITEAAPGGELVCILGFSARPRNQGSMPIPKERRTFRVGERVRYVSSFFKGTPEDNPTGHMAVFEPLDQDDMNRYAAAASYFVSLDCWEGLRKYFASTLVVMERDLGSDHPNQGTYVLTELKEARRQVVQKKGSRKKA
jgi:hypothetical protein